MFNKLCIFVVKVIRCQGKLCFLGESFDGAAATLCRDSIAVQSAGPRRTECAEKVRNRTVWLLISEVFRAMPGRRVQVELSVRTSRSASKEAKCHSL